MSIICLVDNSEHEDIYSMHVYLRSLKIKQEEYYLKYLPRFDLLTNEPLKFKEYKSYLIGDFANKNNLKKYCSNDPFKGLIWAKKYLLARKEEKKLVNAPHHVYLRTLFCPTVKFFEQHSNYNDFCKDLGLQVKFDYKSEVEFVELPKNHKIIIDTREQKPFKLPQSIVQGLKFADYALDEKNNKGIYVERKSLADFVGTMGKGYERFYKEINKCKEANGYMVVLIETDFNKSFSFNYLPQMCYTKETPEHIFHNMRCLLDEFSMLQFLFVDGRKEAEDLLMKLFEMKDLPKFDLQYCYEEGKLDCD